MPRHRITYTGKVQGVGFRATAASIAARFDITGWVRNEPDRSVLLEVQGDDPEVAAFREALRSRMAGNIKSEAAVPAGNVQGEVGFEIQR